MTVLKDKYNGTLISNDECAEFWEDDCPRLVSFQIPSWAKGKILMLSIVHYGFARAWYDVAMVPLAECFPELQRIILTFDSPLFRTSVEVSRVLAGALDQECIRFQTRELDLLERATSAIRPGALDLTLNTFFHPPGAAEIAGVVMGISYDNNENDQPKIYVRERWTIQKSMIAEFRALCQSMWEVTQEPDTTAAPRWRLVYRAGQEQEESKA